MADDEEEGILIWKGDKEEIFSQAEANIPKEVQQRFQLVYEPTYVLTKNANKKVKFGHLSNDQLQNN